MNDSSGKKEALQVNIRGKSDGKIELMVKFIINNISEGGILIETPIQLEKNSIQLLKLPHKKQELILKGLVKRVEHEIKGTGEIFKIAFQFIEVTPQQLESLKGLIHSIEQKQKNIS